MTFHVDHGSIAVVRRSSFCSMLPALLVLLCASCGRAGDPAAIGEQAAAIVVDPQLVISQVYGGGSNAGATFSADFVELFNRSSTPATLDNLSLQYGSAAGTGTSVSQARSQPAGKIVLVSGVAGLGCNGGSAPCNTAQSDRIIDLVGYGAASFSETTPVGTLSATTAASRAANGCTDTNNNFADFSGGDNPLFGRFQPPAQSSQVQRNGQAAVVASFVNSLLSAERGQQPRLGSTSWCRRRSARSSTTTSYTSTPSSRCNRAITIRVRCASSSRSHR